MYASHAKVGGRFRSCGAGIFTAAALGWEYAVAQIFTQPHSRRRIIDALSVLCQDEGGVRF
jgi:hypothetical protein